MSLFNAESQRKKIGFSLEGYVFDKKPIGEGTYGIVFAAQKINSPSKLAIKKTFITPDDEGLPPTALREISALKRLSHPNIIKLKDVEYFYKTEELYLIFERCSTNLSTIIFNKNGFQHLDLATIKMYMMDILNGLNYLHEQNCMHRDLKPANILIDSNGRLKIADFGLIRNMELHPKQVTVEVATLIYRAPEILISEGDYDCSSDLWSAGCIFAELYNRFYLFNGRSRYSQLQEIYQVLTGRKDMIIDVLKSISIDTFKNIKYRPLNQICKTMDNEALSLLRGLLACDPKERLTAIEALKTSYFKNDKELSFCKKRKQVYFPTDDNIGVKKTTSNTSSMNYINIKKKIRYSNIPLNIV